MYSPILENYSSLGKFYVSNYIDFAYKLPSKNLLSMEKKEYLKYIQGKGGGGFNRLY